MNDQTISAADLLRLLDAFQQAAAPRRFRVRLWGQSDAVLVAWSRSDALARIREISPSARVVGLIDEVAS